ncbi:MAG: carbamoyl-phosphate synthase large subunit [Spirochaetia bacterium]|nr:carbamoyl-phosphate synthase large subunit [Spirochaetia bacterium]
MPRRTDLRSILIPGSGPIIIGQACEFDYSGTQACKALRKEGYRTILVNSNPATIMTDPSLADATYLEPLTPEFLMQIIEKERPDAILPTVGGQTALNLAMSLWKSGFLQKMGVQMIGANAEAIHRAEDREEFKKAMIRIGLKVPDSITCQTMDAARAFKARNGLPLIIRPSFTMGGTGGGIAFTEQDFEDICQGGLNASPVTQILVEQSILGWKEYELEVMRDTADNVVIICSIENLDPMGVHTGDSITIAPQQTLTDVQYQIMRDAALKIIREIGVETGGSNIQFAINPKNGEMTIIEMNPRVSRSSALASKATGFPIAKIAALLAVGYTLDEIPNDITKSTPASFEPTIDYVVTKIPRFAFEKFPGSKTTLGTMMKSVGETMALGRTFKESFQKAFRSLETDRAGYGSDGNLSELIQFRELKAKGKPALVEFLTKNMTRPNPERIYYVKLALQLERTEPGSGFSKEDIYRLTAIDPWFLNQIIELLDMEEDFVTNGGADKSGELFYRMKQAGFSDRQLGYLTVREEIQKHLDSEDPVHKIRAEIIKLLKDAEDAIKAKRKQFGFKPVYRRVDTCAGEFEAHTPYLYSTYEEMDEAQPTDRKKVIILGGGPNRIGQGIEFDYCCCHASYALQGMGIESVMVNSNPETVSTDYDTSDKLYFEPLTLEDVLHICDTEKPTGVIVQFGGQTPLKLARGLEAAGVKILGTSPDAIDRAEDRDRFSEMIKKLGLLQPDNGMAYNLEEATVAADKIGYPVLVRPSYVLGGRAMAIVHDPESLAKFVKAAENINPEHPILIDRFLEDAQELDVDALCDGKDVFTAGILQHIEEAGVHSGDSACVIPPQTLSESMLNQIREATRKLALELGVRGLLNIQMAIQEDKLYIIEVNPRASRTVPFVSKAVGLLLAQAATEIMMGKTIQDVVPPHIREGKPKYTAVKEVVIPFFRFPGSDIILGPEMKSTGEVMGLAPTFEEAYVKAMIGAGEKIPEGGNVFISVNSIAKQRLATEVKILRDMGYKLFATEGTADFLIKKGIEVTVLHKLRDGQHPNPLDEIATGKLGIIINIPYSKSTRDDAFLIRQEAIRNGILCITTVPGVRAFVRGLKQMRNQKFSVKSLQEIHKH